MINFKKRNEKPVTNVLKTLRKYALDPKYQKDSFIFLQKNVIRSNENVILGLELFEKEFDFYDEVIGQDLSIPASHNNLNLL